MLSPIAEAFLAKGPTTERVMNTQLFSQQQPEEDQMSTLTRYKIDIAMLDRLLDTAEEEKLEKIKEMVEQIQEIRKTNPEVALPRRVRDALADFHRAESKFGPESREAKIAREYFLDVSQANDMKPEHNLDDEYHAMMLLKKAVEAVHVLEELKEIAHAERSILDRFGTTDFEIGEGFIERSIGRDDPDPYGLWP